MRASVLKVQRDTTFRSREAIERADAVLAGEPAGVLPRVAPRGVLVHRFVFPLELCSPENRHSHGRNWAHAARKDNLWAVMVRQHPHVRSSPLPGRPMVRQVRFSNSEPDVPGEGFKTAIDFLCVPRPPKSAGGRFKRGLGFLVDDAPRYIERVAWWERVAPTKGFALLEIWSGAAA